MKKRRMLLCCALLTLVALCRHTEMGTPVAADAGIQLEEPVKYVALTFDDGPRRKTTLRLLDGLRERGASATFFLIGQQVEANRDLVARMKAEGHQVGNHTWGHVQLQGADTGDILWEVHATDELLRDILGDGDYWIRPPYGLIGEKERQLLHVPLAHWSVDSRDWELKHTDKIVKRVLQDTSPGSVILMHDIYPTSVDAALRLVDTLQAQGYWFVTLEELFALSGVTPKAGTLYSDVNG